MKNGGDEQILSTSKLAATSWRHVALTFNKVGDKEEVTMYINGEKVGSKDFTIFPTEIAPSLNYIGRSMFRNDPNFKGQIDDLRFYNYVLSQDKIKEAMNETNEVRSKDLSDMSTAIETVKSTANKTVSATYSLDGAKTSGLKKGINIIKFADGSTIKIVK
jgi:hypothetical protein